MASCSRKGYHILWNLWLKTKLSHVNVSLHKITSAE